MKTAAVAATLLAAAPAALATSFYGLSARSASPIHLSSINAAESAFWIGKDTASYCPEEVVQDCPAGNETIFAGGDNTLALDVEVPGGQQVYIKPTGELTYTTAHSAYMGMGAISTGFHLNNGTSSSGLGSLSWTNGFVACPAGNASYPYQIYAAVNGFNKTNCLGFDFLTSTVLTDKIGAWQYA
ncbi:IgE-binding protein [Phyllosticta citrichinensis]|uniref:IgE-binding protein n=1 Tax=Phyllosticta citrichinensis TaxID=1130410 RepID=A0ABR1XG17_9PEZI